MVGDARPFAARQRLQQAGHDEHALDVVERATAHRKPTVAAGGDELELRFQRLGHVEPLDLGARDHHGADLAVVEPEDVAHHLVLLRLDDPGFAPLFELCRDLFLGDAGPRRLAAQPEQAQHGMRGRRQQHHEGLGRRGKPHHRPRRQPRHGLGVHLADALGHQFAEDDGEVRDQYDDTGGGRDIGRRCADAEALDQPGRQRLCERRLADDAVEQPDRGDADLHRGQPTRGVVVQGHCRVGTALARFHHHLQPGLAGRREAHLGHREGAVEQDQKNQQRCIHQRPGRRVPGAVRRGQSVSEPFLGVDPYPAQAGTMAR